MQEIYENNTIKFQKISIKNTGQREKWLLKTFEYSPIHVFPILGFVTCFVKKLQIHRLCLTARKMTPLLHNKERERDYLVYVIDQHLLCQ